MTTWQELDECLADVARRIGAGAHLLTDAGKEQLSPCEKLDEAHARRFEAAYKQLRARFGPSFLLHGTGERLLYQGESGSSFAAEVLLRSYLLVFIFDKLPNFFLVRQELDRAKPLLTTLIERLPPLSGGGRTGGDGPPAPLLS